MTWLWPVVTVVLGLCTLAAFVFWVGSHYADRRLDREARSVTEEQTAKLRAEFNKALADVGKDITELRRLVNKGEFAKVGRVG